MKKPKTLETKLRSAIRLIWSRSKERREILKQAQIKYEEDFKNPLKNYFFCFECQKEWPIQMAEVDHIMAIGTLDINDLTAYVNKMFYSPQRAICKLCHRVKTAEDRKKMRKPK